MIDHLVVGDCAEAVPHGAEQVVHSFDVLLAVYAVEALAADEVVLPGLLIEHF